MKESADIFHGLMCYRYGSDSLTPYMMKCIDIVPILLKSLPFHSMMRVVTEGGERLHYMHQQRFFQHSSRGGGWVYQDPILSIFIHVYRQIRRRIQDTDEENVQKYEQFVNDCIQNRNVSNRKTSTLEMPESGPLQGKRFVLVGSYASMKLTHEKITCIIERNGGKVLNIDRIPESLPVDIHVLSTQKECDKGSASTGVTIAVQRGWNIC